MAVLLICKNPACAELFDAPEHAVGRKVRCPSCGMVQTLDQSTEAAPAESPTTRPAGQAPPPAKPAVPSNESVGRPASAQPVPFSLDDASEQPADEPRAKHVPLGDTGDLDVFDLEPLDQAAINKRSAPVKPKPPGTPPAAPKGPPAKGKTAKPTDDGWELVADLDAASPPQGRSDSTVHLQAQKASLPESLPAKPAEPEIEFSSQLDQVDLSLDAVAHAPHDAQDISDGVLEHKLAAATIFVVGLGGIALGAFLGAYFMAGNRIFGAYLGGAAGWVGGFVVAFLFVLSTEKGEPDKVRCHVCHNVFPADLDVCSWCGAPLTGPELNPLAAGCLRSLSYATTSKLMIAWLTILGIFADGCIFGTFLLLTNFWPDLEQYWMLLVGLCVLIAFGIYSYVVQYFLSAVGSTIKGDDKPPAPPAFWSLSTPAVGFLSLCVLAVYVLPIFTLPLLPLAMLMLGAGKYKRAFDIPGNYRLACLHGKDFSILWLMLLLGSAVTGAGLAVVMIFHFLIDLAPTLEGSSSSGLALQMVISVFKYGLLGGIAVAIFGLMLFRCVGMFGRMNAKSIFLKKTATDESPVAK